MMGAIAVSAEDERRIVRIGKRLGVRTKAGVVHVAVEELERRIDRQERGDALRAYVRKYGQLDRQENETLRARADAWNGAWLEPSAGAVSATAKSSVRGG